MPKIAVTAASGQLGGTIIRRLVKELGPDSVMGLARTPQKASHLGIEIRPGDYNQPSDFETGFVGLDAVLIVSSNAAPEARIQQHRNIIDGARTAGVKRIVYTSVGGPDPESGFSAIIQSNRQTEEDVRNSGLEWSIGRNSLYIEPDLEYIDNYVKEGEIANCAGAGLCTYTSRTELAEAYTHMLLEPRHTGQTYALGGQAISQAELAEAINQVYGTALSYRPMSAEAYLAERKAELGEFPGAVIAGIYVGIRNGAFATPSDFEKATGRPHLSPLEMIRHFKDQ